MRCSGGSRRRIISDDYHLETGDGRRCLRQRVRHHELPLPLPSSSRRPLALECARALEPSADSRVLRFVCLHSFRTPACRQMPQPSPPLPLLLSTCAVASVATGIRSPLNARGLLHNSTDLRVLTAVCFACFVCSRVCSCRSRTPSCRTRAARCSSRRLVTLAFLSKRVVNRELNDEECVCVRRVRKACGLRGSLCLFWAIVL